MRIKKIIRRSISYVTLLFLIFALTSCGSLKKAKEIADNAKEKYDEKVQENEEEKNENCIKILEEKADYYGIDSEGVEVSEGGTYLKVPIDTIHSYEEIEERIVFTRNWLRFAYAELGNRYYVGFIDADHPEVMYTGFSNQDFGYPSEYYWSDMDIVREYVYGIDEFVKGIEKVTHVPAEKFTEITGIDEEKQKEIITEFYKNYPSTKDIEINKEDYDIAFVPGDTINHLEKFVIGEKNCVIEPGTYIVDMPNNGGLIHVTDADDNTKYRLDPFYRDGHIDGMYEYSALPAELSLEKGDIVYITNGLSTFEREETSEE